MVESLMGWTFERDDSTVWEAWDIPGAVIQVSPNDNESDEDLPLGDYPMVIGIGDHRQYLDEYRKQARNLFDALKAAGYSVLLLENSMRKVDEHRAFDTTRTSGTLPVARTMTGRHGA